MTLSNAKTGEMICEEKPLYGGWKEPQYNEPGFIAQPPCLWGDAKYGLDPPMDLDGLTVHVTHRSNATYGHHGEMAHEQMYYV